MTTWTAYAIAYTGEMRVAYWYRGGSWKALLARPRVVLVCYCTDPERCHRRVLAGILTRLGAVDHGEIEAQTT